MYKLDYVNPLKLYGVLRDEGKYPVMLESRAKGQINARYTYISSNPEYMLRIGNKTKMDNETISKESNPFKALKENFKVTQKGDRFTGGYVGYIAYDCIHNYIGGKIEEPSVFGYYDHMYVYDHETRNFYYHSENNNPEELRNAELTVEKAKNFKIEEEDGGIEVLGCDADLDDYVKMVEKTKEYIYAGDAFQVVPSREYRLKNEFSAFQLYRNLRKVNPSPYMFLLEFDKDVVGASPETMASVQNNILKVNPIAGTTAIGKTESETQKLAEALLKDEKERAEHMMLVDLARNDVRKVSKSGSIVLERFFDVVRYSHVQHIESEVLGTLKDNSTIFDAIEAAFPAGTLTGAPKFRAMEIIDEVEKSRRKIYGGAVGYFSNSGNADLAIGIRMAEIDSVCRVRAGGGVVADSVPENEYYETERKMAAMMKALGVQNDSDNR